MITNESKTILRGSPIDDGEQPVGRYTEPAEGIKERILTQPGILHVVPAHNGGKSLTRNIAEKEERDTRVDLLYEVSRRVESGTGMSHLFEQITQMIQHVLKASASSVLLLDEEKQEFVFEVAEGAVGEELRQVRMSIQYGIAGWVARHSRPLIVNDVTKDRRFFGELDKVTGFVTKSIMCTPLASRGEVIGVIEVLNKLDGSDFNDQDLETLTAVASIAAIAIENSRLHKFVIDGYKGTVRAFAAAIDAKDYYAHGHSRRVADYARLAGAALSLPQEELEVLEYAGILHDVGKIGTPDFILNKPGHLTVEEYSIIRKHPVLSASIIHGIPLLSSARTIVLHHHERYDANGYPEGLKGDIIPLGARIVAVADTFDSMTSNRPYRTALSAEQAITELRSCSGTQFCPLAVEAFITGLLRSKSSSC
jgi:HD-GYP domain-containing protein (c-di-GMP phosphodiesterase class II)